MAYNANNLSLLKSVNDGSWNMWLYRSADALATVAAANYVTNAKQFGMKVFDLVVIVDTNVPTVTLATVVTINSTTGAADISAGTAISVT